MKNILLIVLLQIPLLFISYEVYAHKVSNYAYREGDKIFGECYFVDGSPCKNSKVEIYDSKENKILETTTDEKGKYSFNTKEKGTLRIVIFAGEGHRAVYTIKEIEEKKEDKQTLSQKRENLPNQPQASINKDEIKQIIETTIDVKLEGLKTEIVELRKQMDKVYLRDVVGGIGYIFGIWGIIMLIKRFSVSREQKKKNAS